MQQTFSFPHVRFRGNGNHTQKKAGAPASKTILTPSCPVDGTGRDGAGSLCHTIHCHSMWESQARRARNSHICAIKGQPQQCGRLTDNRQTSDLVLLAGSSWPRPSPGVPNRKVGPRHPCLHQLPNMAACEQTPSSLLQQLVVEEHIGSKRGGSAERKNTGLGTEKCAKLTGGKLTKTM